MLKRLNIRHCTRVVSGLCRVCVFFSLPEVPRWRDGRPVCPCSFWVCWQQRIAPPLVLFYLTLWTCCWKRLEQHYHTTGTRPSTCLRYTHSSQSIYRAGTWSRCCRGNKFCIYFFHSIPVTVSSEPLAYYPSLHISMPCAEFLGYFCLTLIVYC